MTFDKQAVFPITALVNDENHLVLGGCDIFDLVQEYGTPLYLYDEATLRDMCQQFMKEFSERYSNTRVLYAAKAFMNPELAKLVSQEGLGIEVVSAGEFTVALAAGLSPGDIYFHGNNKGRDELELTVGQGIGRIVVDNFHELQMLDEISFNHNVIQDILLRLSPGVDPHTHVHTTTGTLDSKFGFSIETGQAEQAIRQSLERENIRLVGVHCHLGSPIFELEPYELAVDTVLSFVHKFKADGLDLREFSSGGGFAIGYLENQLPPPISQYADVITSAVKLKVKSLGFENVKLIIEPGRAIVGRAGVALYTVGAIKDIPGVRKYVSVDGGMGDNIRPALYDSHYEAVVANKMSDLSTEKVTLAGKFCESGDVLIRDILLPELHAGDIIAMPASGAYASSMASNYNHNTRPAIVIVNNGNSRLIRRRETYQDLMLCDVIE